MAGKRQAVADFSDWELQQKAKVFPIIQAGAWKVGRRTSIGYRLVSARRRGQWKLRWTWWLEERKTP